MAKPILVANWKNHPSSQEEVRDILTGFGKKNDLFKKLSFFIAPPHPYLELVGSRGKTYSQLASQDLFKYSKGTYTGAVTPDILKSLGVRLAILGHSERRALGETSEDVAAKARNALRSGIVPLVCIGENVRDNDGEYFEFIREQIKASLSGISKPAASKLVLAYEPSWAIGKSAEDALSPGDLAQAVLFIRKILTDLYGRKIADSIAILYGGSVDPSNAGSLVKEGGVRGLLVGRASLDPKKFEIIAASLLEK